MKFYYIAKRKRRGQVERYAGDGIWEAANKTEARKEIARHRGVPAARLEIRPYEDPKNGF